MILCAQDISTDVLIVIMHEKNKTESSLSIIHVYQEMESIIIRCYYACMEQIARAPGQTCLSSVVSVARCSLLRTTCISSPALG